MKSRVALLMLAPALGFYLLTFAAPIIVVGRLSFFQSNYVIETFVGLRNYHDAVRDLFYLRSFVNAFAFVALIVPALIVVSYTTASVLTGFSERIQSVGRFMLYVPGLSSGLIMTLVWRWLLQKQGLINGALVTLGLPGVPWMTEAWWSRVSIALISLVAGIGGTVILFSASMHSIPGELRDAAVMDGANDREYRRHIVRPLMTPTILLVLLLNIVGIMQMWETMYVLFQSGGPEGAATSPVYEIFMTAFLFGKQGYAAAKGVLLMVVIAAILAVKQRVEKWAR
jgi:multiple sugar transport system permease protein